MNYQINLLPWRLQKRLDNQKQLSKHLILLFLLMTVCCLAITFYLRSVIQNKTKQYQQLTQNMHQMTAAIQQSQLQKDRWIKKIRKDAWIKTITDKRDSIVADLSRLQTKMILNPANYRIERHNNRLYCIVGCRK